MAKVRQDKLPTDAVPQEEAVLAEDMVNHVRDWYIQTRKDEAAILHNEFAAIIEARKPPIEVLLSVLEIVKHEVLANVVEKYNRSK